MLFLIYLLNIVCACTDINISFRLGFSGSIKENLDIKRVTTMYFNYLDQDVNRQSFQYRDDNIIGFLWSGSFINNKILNTNMVRLMEKRLLDKPLRETSYIEYIGSDCRSTAGMLITTTKNTSLIQYAVKMWSSGQHLDIDCDIEYFNNKNMCLDNIKKPVNDLEAGDCFYFKYNSSIPLEQQSLTPTEYLQVYNNKDDFFDQNNICYSEGKMPTFDREISFNYYLKTNKDDNKKKAALNLLNNFSPNTFKQEGDVIIFLWLGEKVKNFDNVMPWLKNEISTSGIPDFAYVQYFESDPEKSIGIVIDSKNNKANVQNIVKTWSKGKTFETYTGFKKFKAKFEYVAPKIYANLLDAGDCDIVPYNGDYSYFIEKFNPGMYPISLNYPVCSSTGKYAINDSDTCTGSIITKDGSCDSILIGFGLTIDDLKKFNKNFSGCDKVKAGDYLCIM